MRYASEKDEKQTPEENEFNAAIVLQPRGYSKVIQNPITNNLIALREQDLNLTPVKEGSSRGRIAAAMEAKQPKSDRSIYSRENVFFEVLNTSRKVFFSNYSKLAIGFIFRELAKVTLPTPDNIAKHLDLCNFKFDLNRFCALRGIKDKKSARKQLTEALKALAACSFSYTYTVHQNHKVITQRAEGGIFTLKSVVKSSDKKEQLGYWQNGCASLEFTTSFFTYLCSDGRHLMQLADGAFQLNTQKFPLSYQLAYRLTYLAQINHKNPYSVQVEKILKAVEFSLSKDRPDHVERDIRSRLEKNLDHLQDSGILTDWYFCNARGQELTEAQLSAVKYSDFSHQFIFYKLKQPPLIKRDTRS